MAERDEVLLPAPLALPFPLDGLHGPLPASLRRPPDAAPGPVPTDGHGRLRIVVGRPPLGAGVAGATDPVRTQVE